MKILKFFNVCRKMDRSPNETLDGKTLKELRIAVSHAKLVAGPLFNLSQRERDLLWKHRYYIPSIGENGSSGALYQVHCLCILLLRSLSFKFNLRFIFWTNMLL